jgi:hypothetical protein
LNQAPVNCSHVVLLGNRQRSLEGAPISPCHIFGAQQRPAEPCQRLHALLKLGRRIIVVE